MTSTTNQAVPVSREVLDELQRLAAIGAVWERDSGLAKWFPLTAQELAKLSDERNTFLAELMNIGNVKRYDRQFFDDDSAFADWAQSRARQHYPDVPNVTITVKP